MANRPCPASDLGTPLTTPSTWREPERLVPLTGAIQASAVRVRIRIPLRFPDDYRTTAAVIRSTVLDARLYVLPMGEALHNRKVINTRSDR